MREKLISIVIIVGLAGVGVYLVSGGGGGGGPISENIAEVLENREAKGKLSICHWWTAGGEKEAVQAALGAFKDQYPHVNVKSSPTPGGAGGAMVMKVKVRIAAGNAPETFQAHPGLEIRPYYDSGTLHKLNKVWDYGNIENRLLKERIANYCKIENDYYNVPIGIHKVNMVWYNKHLFNEYDVKPPEEPVSWDEFWALCDELKRKLPKGKYPLALGDRKQWPGTHVFEQFLAGTNMKLYENFINGNIKASQIEPVLKKLKKFRNYIPYDHAARLWYEAAGKMYAGRYAMYLMGGWVKGVFRERGWKYGEDYGGFSSPGTSGWFGMCVDGFTVPKGSDYLGNGFRWAYMCSTPEVQKAFCPLKEAASAYKGTNIDYNEGTKMIAEELHNPEMKIYPTFTHGTSVPWRTLMSLHSRMSDFMSTPDPNVSRHAEMIANLMNEAEIRETWDIV